MQVALVSFTAWLALGEAFKTLALAFEKPPTLPGHRHAGRDSAQSISLAAHGAAAAFVVLWVYCRGASWTWLLQNILLACIMVYYLVHAQQSSVKVMNFPCL